MPASNDTESGKTLAFIDLETTGFDVIKHEIVEIACVLVKAGPSGYEIIEEIEIKVKPEHIETADPGALRVNGYNEAEWIFAHTKQQAMEELATKTQGAIMIAHNISFDWSFLAHAFSETGVEPKFNFRKIDTLTLAFAKFQRNPDFNRFSLKALCDYFAIENEKAHTALADTRATFEVFKKLMAM